ncbi:hypothetical protein ACU045_03460 [Microbacterium sp. MAHUQ-60]|uniref:hypothetical protein n=1 Tax=unclassified Microbacterium TaxID=2609290 RepID=UPI0036060F7C
MAEEELSPLSGLWDAPPRRDARIPAQPLPSAAPVVHAAARPPAVHRGRLIGGFAAVFAIGVVATTASVLTSGAGITETALTAEADALGHGAAALSGGGAGPHDVGRAGGRTDTPRQTEADAPPDAGDGSGSEGRADADAPRDELPGLDDHALTPGSGSPAPAPEPQPGQPGPSTPPDTGVVAPAPEPAPSPPPAPAPPAPQPVPSAPTPPAATPTPAAAPLAFTGLTENRVALLGIPLLSSYTLTLSGQPGARASVTYGSLPAGSVTFDGSGRAALTIGGTLLGIRISDPVIRASYSDGTEDAAVEARRSSI